jgi:hypothetical protein
MLAWLQASREGVLIRVLGDEAMISSQHPNPGSAPGLARRPGQKFRRPSPRRAGRKRVAAAPARIHSGGSWPLAGPARSGAGELLPGPRNALGHRKAPWQPPWAGMVMCLSIPDRWDEVWKVPYYKIQILFSRCSKEALVSFTGPPFPGQSRFGMSTSLARDETAESTLQPCDLCSWPHHHSLHARWRDGCSDFDVFVHPALCKSNTVRRLSGSPARCSEDFLKCWKIDRVVQSICVSRLRRLSPNLKEIIAVISPDPPTHPPRNRNNAPPLGQASPDFGWKSFAARALFTNGPSFSKMLLFKELQ